MKRRILFLDDSPKRHEIFRTSPFAQMDLVDYATSYEEATNYLANVKYDILFLDHDLSEEDNLCDPDKATVSRTGTDVVKYLINNRLTHNNLLVVVHTFNPAGAQKMCALLEDVGIKYIYQPFRAPGKELYDI